MALQATGTHQVRVRQLPSRVIVYFVLALALFPDLGYQLVYAKLGRAAGALATISASALSQARRRIGVQPLQWIFQLLRGPAATIHRPSSWFGPYRVCALDGTILTLPDTPAILGKYTRQAGHHGGTSYPQARVLALIACGTRSILDAVFGPTSSGETTYTRELLTSMGPGMIILADRNFAAAALLKQIAATGAHYLVRVKNGRHLPVHQRLPDRSYLSMLAGTPVRVITARISLHTTTGQTSEDYTLITTVLDPKHGTSHELIRLYHERWEVESTFKELKSTLLTGKVLRSRTIALVEQEIYALLIIEQLLRTAMSEATNADPAIDPDRASFKIALSTARDMILFGPATERPPGVSGWARLAGTIGQHVLADLMPQRRLRTGPRTVKRAISKYQARSSKPHGPTLPAQLNIQITTRTG
ncbi:IS4 family transposase [Glutamicibacter creatinolyticus]|uniref:IS4 family transposase n=1 Tax=Glutamicibacter creatinolyticus TaxID=162496 RepID=UPI0037C112DA